MLAKTPVLIHVGRLMAVVAAGLIASSAYADVTFPVKIVGKLYRDGNVQVNVNCSSKEGNTVTFAGGDVSLDTLPAFSFDTSCELDSTQGLFPVDGGELFNGDQINNGEVTTTVINGNGKELSRHTVVFENEDDLEMSLEYKATFAVDKDTGTLMPPIRKVRGVMHLVDSQNDVIFVGKWKTGRALPPLP